MTWPATVRRADLLIRFIRGSGKGGQNRNKRSTACQMTHLPTGITARAEDQNSQAQNRAAAFRRLAARLVPLMQAAVRRIEPLFAAKRVRTYHLPRGVVIDHTTGNTYPVEPVLDGDLDPIHKDRRAAE